GAKSGLDGHLGGAKVIARSPGDAGFEVLYAGFHAPPEMIATAAIADDVNDTDLNLHSGAHYTLAPDVAVAAIRISLTDALFIVGGIIPDEDFEVLKKAGVNMVFTPGASLQEVVDYIRKNAPAR